MRKHLISIVLLFVALAAFATGQEGDIVYIDGKMWIILDKPIEYDSVYFNFKDALPKERCHTTANWDGYIAYWSIVQDELCLDSVCCECYNKDNKKYYKVTLPTDTLLSVFRKFYDGKRIVAKWVKFPIRIARGHLVYYEHMAYMRNYEEERIVNFLQGKVTDIKSFHNYFNKGLSFDENVQPTAWFDSEAIRKLFPLHTERYPELKGVKTVRLAVNEAEVDTTGRMVKCEVEATCERRGKKKSIPGLAAEMEELMKAYYPWRVYYIYGEYRFGLIKGRIFNYEIDKKKK